jgi:glutathionylspermidine synthase
MRRVDISPRRNWQKRVEEVGLTFHTAGGVAYWNEAACYELTAAQVDELETATNTLHGLCLGAAQHVIDHKLYGRMGIPPHAVPLIERAWEEEPPSIYGRFDFSYDGKTPPKMLEYNADTPTSLLEAAVAQWFWLQDVAPGADQFNSIHERLLAAWAELKPYLRGSVLHFASLDDPEDGMTATYLQDTAHQAGIATEYVRVHDIGWDAARHRFVDPALRPMESVFKLYPWEWMVHEEFGEHLRQGATQWIEPAWKMVLSNKGILPVLWELFPECPYLLPAYFDAAPLAGADHVRKPLLSREGANVSVHAGGRTLADTGGDYGEEGYVYQAYAPLPDFGGHRPVVGSWVIAQEAAGIGIRESGGVVTDNFSRFVPHLFR